MEANLHIKRGPSSECFVCGRELSVRKSVERGIGPVCRRRFQRNLEARMQMQDVYLNADIRDGFIFNRWQNGTPATNVLHLVVEHSLAGFEWGSKLSDRLGAYDLSLNIIEIVLKRIGYRGRKWSDELGNSYSVLGGKLHQEFYTEFIESLPHAGGRIEYHQVLRWICKRLIDQQRELLE